MDYLSVFTEMLLARGLADNTVRNYQTYIRPYLAYLQGLGLSPDDASWQVMRDYLRHIKESRSLSDRMVNMAISHLQFFHVYVLHFPFHCHHFRQVKKSNFHTHTSRPSGPVQSESIRFRAVYLLYKLPFSVALNLMLSLGIYYYIRVFAFIKTIF